MGMLVVECDTDKVSDGYHTFGELYRQRCLLFALCMRSHPERSWRSLRHHDGSAHEGWFLAGMRTPKGDVTYHLPESMWCDLHGIQELPKAPPFDGHTSHDVLDRLEGWVADQQLWR